jgi:hypothetical protein
MTRISNPAAPGAPSQTPAAGGADYEAFKAGMTPLDMPALRDASWNGSNAGGEVRSIPRVNTVPGKAPAR